MSPTFPVVDLSGDAARAWNIPTGYRQGMVIPADQRPRVCLATKSIQRRLIDLGILHADPAKLGDSFPNFGAKTNFAVREFQTANGLKPDGVVGRLTSTALWRPLYGFWQDALGIADNLLMGQGYLESVLDTGAEGDNPQGYDWYDRGVHQINRHAHSEVTDEHAYDAAWAIAWSAGMLHDAFVQYGAWNFAVAKHNNPAETLRWSQGVVPQTSKEQLARDTLVRYVELVYEDAAKIAA